MDNALFMMLALISL